MHNIFKLASLEIGNKSKKRLVPVLAGAVITLATAYVGMGAPDLCAAQHGSGFRTTQTDSHSVACVRPIVDSRNKVIGSEIR